MDELSAPERLLQSHPHLRPQYDQLKHAYVAQLPDDAQENRVNRNHLDYAIFIGMMAWQTDQRFQWSTDPQRLDFVTHEEYMHAFNEHLERTEDEHPLAEDYLKLETKRINRCMHCKRKRRSPKVGIPCCPFSTCSDRDRKVMVMRKGFDTMLEAAPEFRERFTLTIEPRL